MKKIDFLPPRFREENDQRKRVFWRGVAVVFSALMMSIAVAAKYQQLRMADGRLEITRSRYDAALIEAQKLGDLNGQLAVLDADAELLVYLRHAWPRTQVLAAVLPRVPDSVRLRRLRVAREGEPQAQTAVSLRDPVRAAADAEAGAPQLSPAHSDLAALRQELDAAATVVILEGTTDDMVALNGYLGQLSDSALIRRAELESIESLAEELPGRSSFRARLTLSPGYGQPGGPDQLAGGPDQLAGEPAATGGAP